MTDTIFALSTARGRAGVAVFRLSGPQAGATVERLTGRAPPPPRRAALRAFQDPLRGHEIDRGLVLFFGAPASFSGEDMAEFHVHGGRGVIEAMTSALGACDGLRPADAGEFTRRAFENGKMDLTAVEGLADLIAAETEAQRAQALRQMRGRLGALYEDWRSRLVSALAHLEAEIDFAEEELPEDMWQRVRPGLEELAREIGRHLDDDRRGERLRDGYRVVLLGAPNAGKSSILNSLARRDAAIVAETAGTTRDVIEVHLDLDGLPVTIVDTAGLREATEVVEVEGVRRALGAAEAADLKLFVAEAPHWETDVARLEPLLDERSMVLVNKCDLEPGLVLPGAVPTGQGMLTVSAKTGAGMPELMTALAQAVSAGLEASDAPPITRARHRQALEDCRSHLAAALAGDGTASEVVAEDLRLAARALGRLTGRVDVEDILDVVFADFCIGK